MWSDHDPAVHDRIAIADANADDLRDGGLERLAACLGGELRAVTDSRAVIDLENEWFRHRFSRPVPS